MCECGERTVSAGLVCVSTYSHSLAMPRARRLPFRYGRAVLGARAMRYIQNKPENFYRPRVANGKGERVYSRMCFMCERIGYCSGLRSDVYVGRAALFPVRSTHTSSERERRTSIFLSQ